MTRWKLLLKVVKDMVDKRNRRGFAYSNSLIL